MADDTDNKLVKSSPLDAELIDTDIEISVAEKKKKKRKKMNLDLTEYYVKKISAMPPREVVELVSRQFDAALLLIKEQIFDRLEAISNGDSGAYQELESLTRSSALMAKEKVEAFKVMAEMGILDINKKAPYKAPEMTTEEWEKTFKPGTKVDTPQPEVFTGPVPKTVN